MRTTCNCIPAMSRRSVIVGVLAQPAWLALPASLFAAKAEPSTAVTLNIDRTIDSLMPATPAAARAMAARTVSTCQSIAQTGGITIKQLLASDRAIAEGARKLAALESRKRTVLDQLRRGDYCSQCTRSKVEIEEAENNTFEAHLRRVNGHRVPAPDDVVQKKMAEFNKLIADEEKGAAKAAYEP